MTPRYYGQELSPQTPNPYADELEMGDVEMMDAPALSPEPDLDCTTPARVIDDTLTYFMSQEPSNNMLKRLRKLIGVHCDRNLQIVEAALTELTCLIKQIKVLLKGGCDDNISAICSRIGIIVRNQVKVNSVFMRFESVLAAKRDHSDVFNFAMPYVARLRSIHRPIVELQTWSSL